MWTECFGGIRDRYRHVIGSSERNCGFEFSWCYRDSESDGVPGVTEAPKRTRRATSNVASRFNCSISRFPSPRSVVRSRDEGRSSSILVGRQRVGQGHVLGAALHCGPMLSWTSWLRSEPVVAWSVPEDVGRTDVADGRARVHAVVLFIETAAARAEAVHAVLPAVFHTPSGRMHSSEPLAAVS